MSIRATFALVFVVLFGLLAAIVILALRAADAQEQVAGAEFRRFESWKLADELRQSSDDLTRMARTFVVTGNPVYAEYFQAVLDIRNGERPRPVAYDGIYWDTYIATGTPPTADGPAVSLDELMHRLAFSEQEFEKLGEAQANSNELVALEDRAMNAVRGRFPDESALTIEGEPDGALARSLMHGRAYHEAKAAIMEPIDAFFGLLEARTTAEVERAAGAARLAVRRVVVLTATTAAISLASFLLLVRMTIVPIRRVIARLRDIAEGEGDLTRQVDDVGRNEMGELARWFNQFVAIVRELAKGVAGATGTVATSAAEIAASAREQEGTVGRLQQSTQQIAAAVHEISATGSELAGTMEDVSAVARSSSVTATASRQGLGTMEATAAELMGSTRSIDDRLAALDEKAAGIGRIVTMIVTVADQTNLLSVNAAIEADKAGTHGAGFTVVASEIRRLADQTAAATLEIERDVGAMQDAMAAGRAEMATFGDRVQGVVTTLAEVSEQIGEILGQVEHLARRFESVNDGMGQQSAGIRQINDAMGALSGDAGRSAASIAEFTLAADRLHEATSSLESQIGRFRM